MRPVRSRSDCMQEQYQLLLCVSDEMSDARQGGQGMRDAD